MVVVVCCRRGAHALADSRFLCKHTWERATETEDDGCPECFIHQHPVAFKMMAVMFVTSLATWT